MLPFLGTTDFSPPHLSLAMDCGALRITRPTIRKTPHIVLYRNSENKRKFFCKGNAGVIAMRRFTP